MNQQPHQSRMLGHLERAEQTERIEKQIDLLRLAVKTLNAEGHTILAAGVGEIKPFVFLAPSPLLDKLVAEGKAAYNVRGHDDEGNWRKGQLLDYRNVFVYWLDRG